MQDTIINVLSRALQVLKWLVPSFCTQEGSIINRWLQEGIASSLLDFLISDLLELFICISLENTVNEVVCHTLLTLLLSAHEGVSLLAENVQTALQIFQDRLLRTFSALFKGNN